MLVILNLARNSCKFVTKGFVRLRAIVADGVVVLSVEDSGSGIPESKRQNLFRKYQESLDMLSQGTGLGLALCRHISQLLDADIYLDDTYSSGIEGHPGARIAINLKQPPLQVESIVEVARDGLSDKGNLTGADSHGRDDNAALLPEHLSVLFVDGTYERVFACATNMKFFQMILYFESCLFVLSNGFDQIGKSAKRRTGKHAFGCVRRSNLTLSLSTNTCQALTNNYLARKRYESFVHKVTKAECGDLVQTTCSLRF